MRRKGRCSEMMLKSGEVFFSENDSSFMIPETLSLFGLSVSFYGLLLLVAAVAGIIVSLNITRKKRQNEEGMLTLLTLAIIFALLGARLYYVIFEWETFLREPLAILNFRNGGLSYFGALFGAWFVMKGYCRKKGGDFARYADTVSMGAAVAAPFIWAGCACVREPLGTFYDGLFSVRIGAEYITSEVNEFYTDVLLTNVMRVNEKAYVSMHPVALYGIVLSCVSFAGLCVVNRKAKADGTVFSAYLMLNAVMILILECFRADRYCIWGTTIPANSVVAGVVLLVVLYSFARECYLDKKQKGMSL